MTQRDKEQQRLTLMPGVTHFQTEVGPHVQLNQVRLSKNFLPAKWLETVEPRTYKRPPREILILDIVTFLPAFKVTFCHTCLQRERLRYFVVFKTIIVK